MLSFKNFLNRNNFNIIVESVNNDNLFVVHRSPDPIEFSSIWTQGIVAKKNESFLYGQGLYTVYRDIAPKKMYWYGFHILRGSVNIKNFGILEENVYNEVSSHSDGSRTFEEHLSNLGVGIVEYEKEPFSSEIGAKYWKQIQNRGYDGLILHGKKDGYVCVIWEQGKNSFKPHSYINGSDKLGSGEIKFFTGNEEDQLIKQINSSEIIEKDLDLAGAKNIKTLGIKLTEVLGDLNLSKTNITSLGNLKKIHGNLFLRNCQSIFSLGQLIKANGLYASDSSLETLGSFRSCGGDCNLKNTNIKNLNNLNKVSGYLNLENTPIESIKNLNQVKLFLNLKNTPNLSVLGERPESVNNILYDKGSKTEYVLKKYKWILDK